MADLHAKAGSSLKGWQEWDLGYETEYGIWSQPEIYKGSASGKKGQSQHQLLFQNLWSNKCKEGSKGDEGGCKGCKVRCKRGCKGG